MTEVLHFLLVPDRAAARRVRRAFATRGACAGTVVGTWGELVGGWTLTSVGINSGGRSAELAKKTQDIFLTHHSHLVELAKESVGANVLHVQLL